MTSKTVNTIIDDADGQAQYSIGWESAGSSNEYNHTTKATRMQGATFTLKFVGTSIKVYGTLTEHQEDNPGTFPNTTYSLDGDTPVRFAGIPSGAPQYQQLFYQSPPLPNLEHTLVGTCADNGSMVWLDYFVVEMIIDSGQPASSLSSLPTHTVTSVVAAPSAPVASASRAFTPPIGAIVGGIVGGFALLLLTLAFFLWIRRYQRESPHNVPIPRPAVPTEQALIDSNTYTYLASGPQQLDKHVPHTVRQPPTPQSGDYIAERSP